MNGTKSKIMFIMCMALGLMSIGYAFFATNLSITSTGNITAGWSVKFVRITDGNNGGTGGSNASTPTFTDTTATISANLRVPGDYMEYEVVLQNAGGIDAIIEKINVEETGSPAIIFSVTGINEGETLASGLSKTMKIRVEYDKDVTSQPSDTVKVLKISVKAVQDAGGVTFPEEDEKEPDSYDGIQYLKNKILSDNTAQTDTNIDFSKTSEETNTNGLYYTSTNTEGNKTTYYFRGNVENNYVKFGTYNKNSCTYNGVEVSAYKDIDMIDNNIKRVRSYSDLTKKQCEAYSVCSEPSGEYTISTNCSATGGTSTGEYATYASIEKELLWRIVRINEDGSIRLVTEDSVGASEFEVVGYYIDWNGYTNAYMRHDDNIYLGYMYVYGVDSVTDSTIKTYLDNWYLNNSNLSNYIHLISGNAGFCNDRSISSGLGYDLEPTTYNSYTRLVNDMQPQFKCYNATNDLFTLSSSNNGNKLLSYPLGLLTADEVIYAGGKYNVANSSMYLTNGHIYATMSPSRFVNNGSVDDDGFSYLWHVSSNSSVVEYSVDNIESVRPVINLAPSVELSTELPSWCSESDGTLLCPYIIKTN